jgi:hypothetical protein
MRGYAGWNAQSKRPSNRATSSAGDPPPRSCLASRKRLRQSNRSFNRPRPSHGTVRRLPRRVHREGGGDRRFGRRSRRFAKDLVCSWVRARQAMGADPDETARLILACHDDDRTHSCMKRRPIWRRRSTARALRLFERIVRSRWEETSATPDRRTPGRELAWRDVLEAIYEAQRDAKRYADVCERTGTAPGDCERLARIASARGKPGEALAWTERGLAIEKGSRLGTAAGVALAELRSQLLVKLGRPEDARAAAWMEFMDRPGALSYRDLIPAWRRAARRARTCFVERPPSVLYRTSERSMIAWNVG